MIRCLFKWSLQLTGLTIVGYNYLLKPQQQANCYGFYRSFRNSMRTSVEIFRALREYKSLTEYCKITKEAYNQKLHQINLQTAQRIMELSKQNRGVYIRLAQNLAHMKLAFPIEFSQVLSNINFEQSKQDPLNYSYIKRYLQKQLGKSTKLQFQSLNTTPISCNVFSQTYKGQLIQSFADVLVTIVHPYARSQLKYDFWFLNKAANYCNSFQKKYFPESEPLLINQFLNNLQKSIKQELDVKQEQQISKKIKKTFQEKKMSSFVPHYLDQISTHNLKIVQSANGVKLSNLQDLKANLFDFKILSSQIWNTFNVILKQGNFIYDFGNNLDISLRKAWQNQTVGPQILCFQNFSRRTHINNSIISAYQALWKGLIQKKVGKGKQKQKKTSIQNFYKSLPDVLLYQTLKNNQLVKQISQKQLDQQKLRKISEFIQNKFSSQVKNVLIDQKLMNASKKGKKKKDNLQTDQQTLNNYQYLSKMFQITYEPWKFQNLFNFYMKIFQNPLNFGVSAQNK